MTQKQRQAVSAAAAVEGLVWDADLAEVIAQAADELERPGLGYATPVWLTIPCENRMIWCDPSRPDAGDMGDGGPDGPEGGR